MVKNMFRKLKVMFRKSSCSCEDFIIEKLDNGYLLNKKKYLKTKEDVKTEANNFIDKELN